MANEPFSSTNKMAERGDTTWSEGQGPAVGRLRFAILITLLKKKKGTHTHTLTPNKTVERIQKEKKYSLNPPNLYLSSFQIHMPKCVSKNTEENNQITQVGTQSEKGSLTL